MQSILEIALFYKRENTVGSQSYQGLKAGQGQKEKVNALTRKRDILTQGALWALILKKLLLFGTVSSNKTK